MWRVPTAQPAVSEQVGDQAEADATRLPSGEEAQASPVSVRIAPSRDSQNAEQTVTYLAQQTSLPQSQDSDEFMTPLEGTPEVNSAFSWWPVPTQSLNETESAGACATAYHSNVRLSDGRVGLLVDPGSYGNLVGEKWLAEAAIKLGQMPTMLQRPNALSVGGVGKGAQTCRDDCRLPLTLLRADGSEAIGSFTGPVVQGSGCPALLGLKSLQQNRALLDLDKGLMHFLAEGEPTLILPPGSETFKLEAAQSGHLLLPVEAVAAGAPPGDHHLFAEASGSHVASSQVPGTSAACSVSSNANPAASVDEEQRCAEVNGGSCTTTARDCLVTLAEQWRRVTNNSAKTLVQQGCITSKQNPQPSYAAVML